MGIPLILYDHHTLESTKHIIIVVIIESTEEICVLCARKNGKKKKEVWWMNQNFSCFLLVSNLCGGWCACVSYATIAVNGWVHQSNFSHKICISFLFFLQFTLLFVCFVGPFVVVFMLSTVKSALKKNSYDILLLSFKSILLIC